MTDEMATPAASSLAELMREPVDSCSMAELKLRLFTRRAVWANNAFTLVLITGMTFSKKRIDEV